MALSIGIVGLPNVGKSTLFNALTEAGILAANYPFATIDPNTGVVPIPDSRVEALGELFESNQVIHATVTFVDIAGLVKGASDGEGLGNQFLANIRDVSAICHVVRAFSSQSVIHVGDDIEPAGDIEVIEAELAIADLQTIDKRLPKLEKEARGDRSLIPAAEVMGRVRDVVASGTMLSRDPELLAEFARLSDLQLLTAKPVIYVFNCDEATLSDDVRLAELAELVAPADALFLDAQIEAELVDIEPDDRGELLKAVGQSEPGLNAVVRAAYHTLGLQSYLTVGEKAARAWTIPAGATAPEAAGVIHTDFQKGFIAAEIVPFEVLMQAGSWQKARSAGVVRTEGKTYVMGPSDVVDFRFNV